MFCFSKQTVEAFFNYTAKMLILSSLSLAAAGCQTGGSNDREAKELKILQSRVSIIRNSLNSGQAHVAMRDLRHLLRKHPKNVELNSLMGLSQLALKNAGRATKYFRTAYRLDSTVPNALNLSSALIENGESLKSVKLLKSLLKRKNILDYTYQERIYHNVGYAFYKIKRFATAEKWFKRALVENPSYFQTHLQLARLYEQSKRPALARREYRSAIDYCHICYEPVYSLSHSFAQIGRMKDAKNLLRSFTRVEGISPKDKIRAQKMIKWVSQKGLRPTRVSRRKAQFRKSKG